MQPLLNLNIKLIGWNPSTPVHISTLTNWLKTDFSTNNKFVVGLVAKIQFINHKVRYNDYEELTDVWSETNWYFGLVQKHSS